MKILHTLIKHFYIISIMISAGVVTGYEYPYRTGGLPDPASASTEVAAAMAALPALLSAYGELKPALQPAISAAGAGIAAGLHGAAGDVARFGSGLGKAVRNAGSYGVKAVGTLATTAAADAKAAEPFIAPVATAAAQTYFQNKYG